MTHSEKIHKLSNAIRAYRGAYEASSGVWIRRPELSAKSRIHARLEQLGINTPESWAAINGFKTVGEFREWIGKL